MPKPLKIFFAYARADQALRDELDMHLAFLRRSNLIEGWYDGNISAGEEWQQAIDHHLHTADIILLLVSPNFIASDYCYDVEMKKAMVRHEAGEAVVIPVILRPCRWKYAPFGKLQALPKDARPIIRWANSDDAFDSVAETIDTIVRQLHTQRNVLRSPALSKPTTQTQPKSVSVPAGPPVQKKQEKEKEGYTFGDILRSFPSQLWTSIAVIVVLIISIILIIVGFVYGGSFDLTTAIATPTLDSHLALNSAPTVESHLPLNSTPVPYAFYSSPDLGIRLEYPDNWLDNEEQNEVVLAASAEGLQTDTVQAANMRIGKSAEEDISIHDLFTEVLDGFPEDVEILNEDTISIASQTWSSTQLRFDNEDGEGQSIANISVTTHDGEGYYLIAVAPAQEWNTVQPIFQDVINSLTFINDSPMILIPAGPFKMGGNADVDLDECLKLRIGREDECQRYWYEDEEPQHNVKLDTFYIDQYEVTNVQYSICVDDNVCEPPGNTASFTRDRYYNNSEFADYPVIYVDWKQAKTYCEWRGARLPTEAEWEKAARGTEGMLYSWGNTFDGGLTNFCDSNCDQSFSNKDYDDGYADTAPVGSYPEGVSSYGVYDVAGNVWEWVADWYDSNYYSNSPDSNPLGPTSGNERVVRGGGWSEFGNDVRTSHRFWKNPSESGNDIGFRCARSP
ncbi:MAG: SUMF1/EgtB/PvdO family nonheme iron enzyme [Anaerolineae bacterium]|nr:SUMF1/EgtB/PvdO family nonheme iron enzyme [Anaerolineae bacterium]